MANRQPILGHDSLRAAVEALAAQGANEAQIIDALLAAAPGRWRYRGDVANRVRQVLAGRFGRSVSVQPRLDRRVFNGLAVRAADRGESPAQLAARLVSEAIRGDLVDAILDEDEDDGAMS